MIEVETYYRGNTTGIGTSVFETMEEAIDFIDSLQDQGYEFYIRTHKSKLSKGG